MMHQGGHEALVMQGALSAGSEGVEGEMGRAEGVIEV